MAFRRLFVLLEGDDDERFFEEAIKPIFAEKYDHVHFWKYSQMKKQRVNNFLNSIKSMQARGLADALLVADLDESPCVTDRKDRVLSTYRALAGDFGAVAGTTFPTRVLIVCKEIERWYLAGLNEESCNQIGVPTSFNSTDHVTKEQFNKVMPSRFKTRIAFMEEILQVFDQETARAKNASFKYFMQKYASGEGAYNLP